MARLAAHVDLLPPLDGSTDIEAELAWLFCLSSLTPGVSTSGSRTRRHGLFIDLSFGVDVQTKQSRLSVVILVGFIFPNNHHSITFFIYFVPFLNILFVIDPFY